jgi:hypothetical protein
MTSAFATRRILDLGGLWDFRFEGPVARLEGEGRTIRVPGIWQTQFPELRNAQGAGRYARKIELPEDWAGARVVLVMEGVFHEAAILVNDKRVAAHGDGWTDISVDLTEALSGARHFTLGVEARVPDDRDPARGGFGATLAGKQDWYGIHGGIWKPARLEARSPLHFASLAVEVSTDLSRHEARVTGALSRDSAAAVAVTLSRGGAVVARREFAVDASPFDLRMPVGEAELWSPDAPELYEVAVELALDQEVVDRQTRSVGFRRFETRDGRLFLNGQPFYMFGALDQDWYPEEDCRHPDEAFLEQRFRNAKAMGLNTLRCHVKVPDRLYLDLTDRLGLIVWLDMPYMEFLAPSTREDLRRVFRQTVATHGHHPSICVWTLFNEGWGIDLDDNPDDRAWLIETFDAAKALVPHALVVDNSPCFPRNYHVKTDIEDFHWYNAFPAQNEAFAATAREFAARAAFTWSPHGDAIKSGAEPLICSEFGVWGLPHPRDILEKDGSEPWWFESGHDWNGGAAYPHGIETRFRDAQLAPIFGDLDGFVDAAQEFQFRGLKYQIETLRWSRAISGYVVTELNDVQWEANGLMDVRNNPRRFAARLAELQRPWLVIARAERTAIAVGERVEVAVRLAGADAIAEGARLVWRFGEQRGELFLTVDPLSIALTGEGVGARDLELEAFDGAGRLLSRNVLEFCVVPRVSGGGPALFPADAGAEAALAAMAYPDRADSLARADVALATRLTTSVRELLLAGRKVLLLAGEIDALVDPERGLPRGDLHNFPRMGLHASEGSAWDGRWMGAFTWRRVDGPWSGLPGGPMLDEHWRGLLPRHVLTGFRSTAFGGLVDAGMAVAWLHKAAAFTKREFLGKGWMTVSTFELQTKAAAENPLAPHLLRALAES